jgi:hypothetical protein
MASKNENEVDEGKVREFLVLDAVCKNFQSLAMLTQGNPDKKADDSVNDAAESESGLKVSSVSENYLSEEMKVINRN